MAITFKGEFNFMGIKWLPIAFLVLLVLSACQNDEIENLPPIEEENMVEILVEALIVEPALRELPKLRQDTLNLKAYERILSKKGYVISDFIESMQWLQSDPRRLSGVYDKVLEELTKKEAVISDNKSDVTD